MLPWLVHGARLTLQNLWATPTVNPANMPIVFLPFSQYELDLVAGTLVVGSAIAGIIARVLAARGVQRARVALLVGVLIAQFIALLQTSTAVARGLRHPGGAVRLVDDSLAYLVIMIVWLVVMIVVGAAVFALLTRRTRSAVTVGTGIVAVSLEAWIRGFVAPIGTASATPNDVGLFIAHWAPAVAVAAVIVWAGVGSAGKAVSAITALVVLWIGTAAIIAVASAAGSRALARVPVELIGYFGSVFVSELISQALPLALVAAGLALIGLAIRWIISRSLTPR
jgi:iron complex transport system permease protein